jgi:hypothetical protein
MRIFFSAPANVQIGTGSPLLLARQQLAFSLRHALENPDSVGVYRKIAVTSYLELGFARLDSHGRICASGRGCAYWQLPALNGVLVDTLTLTHNPPLLFAARVFGAVSAVCVINLFIKSI